MSEWMKTNQLHGQLIQVTGDVKTGQCVNPTITGLDLNKYTHWILYILFI